MQSAFTETLSQWRLRDILRVEPPRPCLTPPLCAQRHNVSPMFDNLSDPIFVPKDSLFLQCLTILFRPKTDCSCSAWLTPWHYVWAERHNVPPMFDDLSDTMFAPKYTMFLSCLTTFFGPKNGLFPQCLVDSTALCLGPKTQCSSGVWWPLWHYLCHNLVLAKNSMFLQCLMDSTVAWLGPKRVGLLDRPVPIFQFSLRAFWWVTYHNLRVLAVHFTQ